MYVAHIREWNIPSACPEKLEVGEGPGEDTCDRVLIELHIHHTLSQQQLQEGVEHTIYTSREGEHVGESIDVTK